MPNFIKTSLQLPPEVLSDMDNWIGMTRSEALRLSVERGHYLSTANSEEVAGIAHEYAAILREALKDLGYDDYRLAARSLPTIVAGFVSEGSRVWRYEHGDYHELNVSDLLSKLNAMTSVQRIALLDCVVAERLRSIPALATDYKGEERVERHLWEIVVAEANSIGDTPRYFKHSLVAMVFAALAIEAHLNFVGERLAPEIWKEERVFFKKEPYRGWEGKLRKVLELIGLPWSTSDPQLSAVLELKALRDFVVHGNAEKLQGRVVHPGGTEPPLPASTLHSLVLGREELMKLLQKVERFANRVHAATATRLEVAKRKDLWFGKEAFRGPLFYNSRVTSPTHSV